MSAAGDSDPNPKPMQEEEEEDRGQVPTTPIEFVHGGNTYEIWCGRNAANNDQLLDFAAPEDLWFHVANVSSGHVILRNPRKEALRKIPKQVVKRCACICKATIKVRGTCTIMYTERKRVTKTDAPGRVIVDSWKEVVV